MDFDNASLRFFFLLGGHQNIRKGTCIALCSLLDFPPAEFPMPSFDRPFGNGLGCLGCFTVSPICLDYRHTEWTGCGSAWLYVANMDWHPPAPQAPTSVLKSLFPYKFCIFVLFCFFILTFMARLKISHIPNVPVPVHSW